MSIRLVEHVASTRPLRVDREAGIIFGAKLLGWSSANGRRYLPEGVDPQMYANRAINANHVKQGQERSVYDRIGLIKNPVKRKDGIYADLHLLKSHPLAPAMLEAAEVMPGVFGLSHSARGAVTRGPDGDVIRKLDAVESCDLVGAPATTQGLAEGVVSPDAHGQPSRAELARLKARDRLRAAADAAGVTLSTVVLETLRPGSAADARALVAELKGRRSVRTLESRTYRSSPADHDRVRRGKRMEEVIRRVRNASPRLARLLEVAPEGVSNERGLLGMDSGTSMSGVNSPGGRTPVSHPEESLRRKQLRSKVLSIVDDQALTIEQVVAAVLELLADPEKAVRSDAELGAERQESFAPPRPVALPVSPAKHARAAARLRESRQRSNTAVPAVNQYTEAGRRRIGKWLSAGV